MGEKELMFELFKRFLGLMLAVCLIFASAAALAAPVRDKQTMGITVDTRFEELISLYAGAAILRNVPSLKAGETPPQALVEGALLVGLESAVLPRSSGSSGSTDSLGLDTLKRFYSALFMTGEYTPIASPSCPCITRGDNDSLSFDYSSLSEDMMAGAYIYAAQKTADGVVVTADVYTAPRFFGRVAETIPEDCLTWETTMTLTLKKDDSSSLGYRLVSYETTPGYLDGALSEWQTVTGAAGYTATLPSIFQKTGEGQYQTADGSARLSVQAQADARSEKLDYYLSRFQSANPGAALTVEADLGYFTGVTATSYTLCVALEGNGQVYTITLQYPAERAAEFLLYAEIIRNSFGGEGLAVG